MSRGAVSPPCRKPTEHRTPHSRFSLPTTAQFDPVAMQIGPFGTRVSEGYFQTIRALLSRSIKSPAASGAWVDVVAGACHGKISGS